MPNVDKVKKAKAEPTPAPEKSPVTPEKPKAATPTMTDDEALNTMARASSRGKNSATDIADYQAARAAGKSPVDAAAEALAKRKVRGEATYQQAAAQAAARQAPATGCHGGSECH